MTAFLINAFVLKMYWELVYFTLCLMLNEWNLKPSYNMKNLHISRSCNLHSFLYIGLLLNENRKMRIRFLKMFYKSYDFITCSVVWSVLSNYTLRKIYIILNYFHLYVYCKCSFLLKYTRALHIFLHCEFFFASIKTMWTLYLVGFL